MMFFFFFQAEDGIRDIGVMEFRRVLFRSDADHDGQAEADDERLGAHADVAPEPAAQKLLAQRRADTRRRGHEERVPPDEREHDFPRHDEGDDRQRAEREATPGPHAPAFSSSLSAFQMASFSSLNSGDSRIS